jgi:glycosyltransferase involved in cell wall biosynthesis
MVARLEEYKGQSTLLSSIKQLLGREPHAPIYAVLCGDGAYRSNLEMQAEQLGISDRIRMVGFCRDIAPYYGIMDINVNASYGTETSSLALSEGMSVGVPAIASDFGGNPYMIRDGYNGLLFPAKDSTALTDALLKVYRNRDLLRTFGENAHRFYAKHLTARGMTEQMEALYRTLYQQKKHGRHPASASL